MRFNRMRIENIGPVTEGEVEPKKVTVLLGPNNAGKSIVSRLVHALRRLDEPRPLLRQLGHDGRKKIGGADLSRLYGEAVLLHSALGRGEVATRGRGASRLTVSRGSAPDIDMDFGPPPAAYSAYVDRMGSPKHTGMAKGGSVYIPAGRAGTVQLFAEIVRLRLDLAEFALLAAMQGLGGGAGGSPGASAAGLGEIRPPPGRLPPHIEQFHDLVARTVHGRPGRQFNRSLAKVFGGTIVKHAAGRLGQRQAAYRDPLGRRVPIGSAGSGLLASAPILAGLHYVGEGGALIVEEPEAHVEPSAQLALMDEMVSVSLSKNVQLVLATHSDYVVRKVLALVAGKRVGPSDVGMYYFRRDGRSRTRIERVRVDPAGAADQEMFREALDSLVEEFSV